MKIQHIYIKNFKGIDNLSLDPRKINLIVGRNNSGKTSILEAIDLSANQDKIDHFSPFFSKMINVHSNLSEITVSSKETETIIRISNPPIEKVLVEFKKELKQIFYYSLLREFRFRHGHKDKEPVDNVLMRKEIEAFLEELPLTGEFMANLQNSSVSLTRNGEEKVFFAYDYENEEFRRILTNISELLARRVREKFNFNIELGLSPFFGIGRQTALTDLRNGKKRETSVLYVEDLLRVGNRIKKKDEGDAVKTHEIGLYIKKQKLIDNFEGFNFPFFVFSYENEGKYAVPYSFMGDGLKALVGLLWYLSPELGEHKHKIILLEEPETHMHPGYVRELTKLLVRLAKDLDLQFFITTHSIDFIESFFDDRMSEEKEFLRKELLIMRMEKDTGGYIIPDILDYEESIFNMKKLQLDLRGT